MILENELKKILKKELRETYKHKPLIRDDDLDEILEKEAEGKERKNSKR